MKKIINILLVLLFAAVWSGCQEDPRGIVATDDIAPGPVKNARAISLPGGAKITYELPTDPDLLYVQAVYTINGVEKNTSATLFSDTLEVYGFGTTDLQTVNLYAVDRSGNRSAPEPVTFTPGTPPIKLIRSTLSMVAGFGGIQVSWKNEYKADIVVYILVDSLGVLQPVGEAYSNLVEDKYSLRGLNDKTRKFGVYIRDRWDNFTDTVYVELTPLFEDKLDKSLWVRQLFPGDNNTQTDWWGPWYKICDDIVGDQGWESYVGMNPILFTIDLGVTAKLSRYALWHRGTTVETWEYRHYNPKRWKVYGTNDPNTADMTESYWRVTEGGWTNDWTLLADCYSYKPSGEFTPITQDDRDYANRGFESEFAMDTPPMRYIRFHVTETWGGGTMIHVGELSFWGRIIEE
jgi:hypothetical protein